MKAKDLGPLPVPMNVNDIRDYLISIFGEECDPNDAAIAILEDLGGGKYEAPRPALRPIHVQIIRDVKINARTYNEACEIARNKGYEIKPRDN